MDTLQKPVESILNTALENFEKIRAFKWKRLKRVNYFKKIMNERKIMNKMKQLMNDVAPYTQKKQEISPAERGQIKQLLVNFLAEVDHERLLFDQPFLSYFVDKGYFEVAEEFIMKAKKRVPDLSNEEIFQALRNVWIMNSLQLFWDIQPTLTPSVYSYSMLYPYTDNYIDNPEINTIDKMQFNYHLDHILAGDYRSTDHKLIKKITELVQNIENQYPRADFEQVFESIQLIQDAQVKSLQQSDLKPLSFDEILELSFYKGGTSVLADAFLVKPDLTEEEMLFAFQYGTFLQLIDDLQDISEDLNTKHRTYFNFKRNASETDARIEKLLGFLLEVNSIKVNDTPNQKIIKMIIREGSILLIMEAVSRNQSHITSDLYATLETYSKVRLSFYQKLQQEVEGFIHTLID